MGEWIYSVDLKNQVTVSESQLIELISTGQLSGDVLIWSNGLADWTKVSDSQFSHHLVETAVCAASGRTLPKTEMLQYGEHWLDPQEKDNFVNRLMSGEAPIKRTTLQGPYPYQSLEKTGNAAKWLLIGLAGYTGFFNFGNAFFTVKVVGADPTEALRYSTIISAASLFSFLIMIPAVIFYCIWLYRCSKNCHILAGRPLKSSPGLAVGYYFIPFANFWMPLPDMKEFWKITLDFHSEGKPVSHSIVHWWWGLWMGGGLVAGFVTGFNPVVAPGKLILNLAAATFSSVVQFVASVLIFKIITQITQRQTEIFE